MAHNYQQSRLTSKLKYSLNKKIKVSIKIRNHFVTGILKEFDQHLNLVLEDAEETIVRRGTVIGEPKKLGRIIIRGDSIIYVDFHPESSEIIIVNPPEEESEE